MRRKRSRQTEEEEGGAPSPHGGFLDGVLTSQEANGRSTSLGKPCSLLLTFCSPVAPATSPLSPSLTDEEEDEERNRKRRKKQRDTSHSFKNREEDEVEKDEGRFVVRMAVSLGGVEEGAPLLLHHLEHSRRAGGGSTQPEKVVSVYRPNGFRTPPVLQLR